jgi:glycerophosphoryl diester phosphodiesterase
MPEPLELIAHRGASADAPENTLAAVELAWRQGADAVEADFRLTRDGHVVASHDESLLRAAGVDLRIAEHTLAELRRCDVGRWKGSQWAGQWLPTIDELLAITPPRGRFYVEMKCGSEIAEPLIAAVRRSKLAEEQIVLICFSAPLLAELRRTLSGSPTYLVVEFLRDPHGGVWYPDADERLDAALCHGLTGVDLMAARAVDPGLLKRITAAGLDLCVWTVDEPDEATRLIELGVRRITTNRPGWLREQLCGAGLLRR